jgi:hypothetical protein
MCLCVSVWGRAELPEVSRHQTQEKKTKCRFLHVPLENGLNIGPQNVRLRHYNSIKLCITLAAIHV